MTLHVYEQLEQGTPEWLAARRGIVTASVVGKLIAVGPPSAGDCHCSVCSATKGQPCLSLSKKSATPIKTFHEPRTALAASLPPVVTLANNDTSRALTATLVAERIAGWSEDNSMTRDMERGVLMEPYARDLYSHHHQPVTEVGFMRLDEDWGTLGYSPDGLVGQDGLIEVKAPRAKGHLLTVLDGNIPAHYMGQAQAGLLVSGRKWLDFIPYVSGMPLWTTRVLPDPGWFDAIKAAVSRFEQTATDMTDAYLAATTDLPATERVDFYMDVI